MTTTIQARNNPLTSWLESAAAAASKPASAASDTVHFSSVLSQTAASDSAAAASPPSSGLSAVFSPPGYAATHAVSEQTSSLSETSAAHSGTDGTETSLNDNSERGKVDWGPQGYPFREVPDEDIEPDNAILLWRRPVEPPPLAWQAKLALAEAMRRAGMNPKDFSVSYWETRGENPWGARTYPELTIVLPNGRKVDVSATWTRDTPDITLEDIRRGLALPPAVADTAT
jgi:hypothetical protein